MGKDMDSWELSRHISATARLNSFWKYCSNKKKGGFRPLVRTTLKAGVIYFAIAFSQMSWVQAPCGSLEITGSEPPASRIFTVR